MVREEPDGSISVKTVGDPDAVKMCGDVDWTYIFYLTPDEAQQLYTELGQVIFDRDMRRMMR